MSVVNQSTTTVDLTNVSCADVDLTEDAIDALARLLVDAVLEENQLEKSDS